MLVDVLCATLIRFMVSWSESGSSKIKIHITDFNVSSFRIESMNSPTLATR